MNVYVIFAHEWETGSIMGIEETLEEAIKLILGKLAATDFRDYQPITTNHITYFTLGEKQLGVWIEKWEIGNTDIKILDRQFVCFVNKHGDEIDIEP